MDFRRWWVEANLEFEREWVIGSMRDAEKQRWEVRKREIKKKKDVKAMAFF